MADRWQDSLRLLDWTKTENMWNAISHSIVLLQYQTTV